MLPGYEVDLLTLLLISLPADFDLDSLDMNSEDTKISELLKEYN